MQLNEPDEKVFTVLPFYYPLSVSPNRPSHCLALRNQTTPLQRQQSLTTSLPPFCHHGMPPLAPLLARLDPEVALAVTAARGGPRQKPLVK